MADIAAQWRERYQRDATVDPVELTLPSGLTVRARRLNLHTLFTLGQIPDPLTPLVREWFAIPEKIADPQKRTEATRDSILRNLRDYYQIRNRVWRACVVEPQFWETVEEALEHPDWLPLAMVEDADLQYVFDWANGVGGGRGESLAAFRARYAGATGDDGPGEGVAMGVRPGLPTVRDRSRGGAGDRSADGPAAVAVGAADGEDLA